MYTFFILIGNNVDISDITAMKNQVCDMHIGIIGKIPSAVSIIAIRFYVETAKPIFQIIKIEIRIDVSSCRISGRY